MPDNKAVDKLIRRIDDGVGFVNKYEMIFEMVDTVIENVSSHAIFIDVCFEKEGAVICPPYESTKIISTIY